MATNRNYGTGRRKDAVARVYIMPGTGKVTINKRSLEDYFGLETLRMMVKSPLVLTQNEGKFDVLVNVRGGGTTGQAGAIRHGVARALCDMDAELRPALKKAGFLTRDPRMKERRCEYKKGLLPQVYLLGSNPFFVFIARQRDMSKTRSVCEWHRGIWTSVLECLHSKGVIFLSLRDDCRDRDGAKRNRGASLYSVFLGFFFTQKRCGMV